MRKTTIKLTCESQSHFKILRNCHRPGTVAACSVAAWVKWACEDAAIVVDFPATALSLVTCQIHNIVVATRVDRTFLIVMEHQRQLISGRENWIGHCVAAEGLQQNSIFKVTVVDLQE